MSEWNRDVSQAQHGIKYSVSYLHVPHGAHTPDSQATVTLDVEHGALLHRKHGWLRPCESLALAIAIIGGCAYTELEGRVYAFSEARLRSPAPVPDSGISND